MLKLTLSKLMLENLRTVTLRNLCTSTVLRETTSIYNPKKVMQEQWEEKMKVWMKKYEDLFGITKLTEVHERVLEVQTKVQSIQEKRRKVQEEIFIVQKKLQEMQDILHKTSMGDDMYISVVTQVRELLKEQKRLQDVFSLYDQTEREYQTTLALAINNSQDHERTYREKNKYLSLITGVIGGILGLVGSSVNNWRHRKDIKHFANDISDQVNDLKEKVEKSNVIFSSEKLLNNSTEGTQQTEDIVSKVKKQHELLDDSIRNLQSLISDKLLSDYENYDGLYTDLQVKQMLNHFEQNIDTKLKYHSSIHVSLLGTLLLLGTSLIIYITSSR